MSFYENFVRYCNKVGKTPSKVAHEAGISKSIVSRWKNGGGVTDATVAKIADYFNIAFEDLMSQKGMPTEDGELKKKIFAENLAYYIQLHVLLSEDASEKIGVPEDTLNAWLRAEAYPGEEEILRLAERFMILPADLTEKRPLEQEEFEVPIWVDTDSYDIIGKYKGLSPAQKKAVRAVIETFLFK